MEKEKRRFYFNRWLSSQPIFHFSSVSYDNDLLWIVIKFQERSLKVTSIKGSCSSYGQLNDGYSSVRDKQTFSHQNTKTKIKKRCLPWGFANWNTFLLDFSFILCVSYQFRISRTYFNKKNIDSIVLKSQISN